MNALFWFYTTQFRSDDEPETVRPIRRTYVEGCKTCKLVQANNGFGPAHDASYGCESGKREHCSCGRCF